MKYPLFWKVAALVLSNACFTPALAAPAKQPAGRAYTVKSGDTFAKIARANRVLLAELLKANRLANPDRILLGQRIVIPGTVKPVKAVPESKAVAAKSPSKKSGPRTVDRSLDPPVIRRDSTNTTVDLTPPPPVTGTYVVQSGDTLSRIQRRTGNSVTSLCRANGIKETTVLRPGQKLRLPSGAVLTKQKPVAPAAPPVERIVDTPYVQEPDHVITPPTPPRIEEQPALYEQPASGAPPAPSTTAPHRIGSGETFSSLSRHYGVSHSRLIAANPGVNPNKLRVGQTLHIPGQASRAVSTPPVVRPDGRILAGKPNPLGAGVPVVSDALPTERTRTGYLVEEGENLTQIAQRFHTTERELRRLNRLGESDSIYAGRYILVPFIRQAPPGNAYARRDA